MSLGLDNHSFEVSNVFNIEYPMSLIKSAINLFYVWTGVSTCKIEFHNTIVIFIIFCFIIFGFIMLSDHIVLVFKLYQTILNHNITLSPFL